MRQGQYMELQGEVIWDYITPHCDQVFVQPEVSGRTSVAMKQLDKISSESAPTDKASASNIGFSWSQTFPQTPTTPWCYFWRQSTSNACQDLFHFLLFFFLFLSQCVSIKSLGLPCTFPYSLKAHLEPRTMQQYKLILCIGSSSWEKTNRPGVFRIFANTSAPVACCLQTPKRKVILEMVYQTPAWSLCRPCAQINVQNCNYWNELVKPWTNLCTDLWRVPTSRGPRVFQTTTYKSDLDHSNEPRDMQ